MRWQVHIGFILTMVFLAIFSVICICAGSFLSFVTGLLAAVCVLFIFWIYRGLDNLEEFLQ